MLRVAYKFVNAVHNCEREALWTGTYRAAFFNGLGLISFKKKMSTVLEFLWMTGLAKMSTVWGSTVSA
jgi:hypothetical protein